MVTKTKNQKEAVKTPVQTLSYFLKNSKIKSLPAHDFIRDRIFRRTFPEIGKIKIGCRKFHTKGNRTLSIPVKTDHFIITKTIKGRDGNFVPDEALMKTIAEKTGQDPNKITRIPILLLFNEPRLNFQVWFYYYENRKLVCRGNGETGLRVTDGNTFIEVPCPCEKAEEGKCRPVGRLSCLIKHAKYFGGVWTFTTASIRTIETIIWQLEYFYKLSGGVLNNFVFQLTLNKETVFLKGKPQVIYTVSLLYDADEDNLEGTLIDKIFKKIQEIKNEKNFEHQLEKEKKMLEHIKQEVFRNDTVAEEIEDVREEIFNENFYPANSEKAEINENFKWKKASMKEPMKRTLEIDKREDEKEFPFEEKNDDILF